MHAEKTPDKIFYKFRKVNTLNFEALLSLQVPVCKELRNIGILSLRNDMRPLC